MGRRDQSDIAQRNLRQVWMALKKAESEVFEKGETFGVTTSDIKKHTSLSLTTIYKKLKELKNRGKVHQKGRRYSSNVAEFVKKIAKDFLVYESYKESIEVEFPLVFMDQYLSLISEPYAELRERISKTKWNFLKKWKLQIKKAEITEDEREKFQPLARLVRDATTINILSGHFLYPYPQGLLYPHHGSVHDKGKDIKRVGIYLHELRNAIWRMLLLFAASPFFSFENCGLSLVINFAPRKVLKTAEDKNKYEEYLASLDRSMLYKHFIKTLNERALF